MKRLLNILADWFIALIALIMGWMTLTGSARTIATYLIIFGTIVYTINELTKDKE